MNKFFRFSLIAAALASMSTSAVAQDYAAFREGLIDDIRPQGWLLEFLQRQANGLTGHPEAMAYPYNTCLWAGEIERQNENPDAKDWWRYEQTAYYTDGLLRLGYLLDDEALIGKGEEGISYTINHAQDNGRLGNAKIESLWPMAVFFRAMQADYWAHGDASVIDALERNYLSLNTSLLTNGRRHIVNLEGMLFVYGITKNERLLTMAKEAYDMGGFELDASVAASQGSILMHGVTYAEMLKIPLLLYAYTGEQRYLDLAMNAERKLERDHLLPDGLYTSAEYTMGSDIDYAHETCDITDYTWSLGYFLQVTGQAEWADRLERAIFNAGLGAITKDFKALQYFSSVNQMICTGTSDNNAFKRGKTWMAYRPIHETECCVGNVNRFMPNFASRLWMRGKGDAGTPSPIIATLYAPNKTTFDVGGTAVTITEDTRYPFDGTITFRFSMAEDKAFPFMFRIPGWATEAAVEVNGTAVNMALEPQTFVTLDRTFHDGDVVTLSLGMETRIVEAEGQGRYVERGPLLYTYAIPQQKTEDTTVYSNMNGKKSENPDFKSWSITPDGPFNYGIDEATTDASALVTEIYKERLDNGYPFDLDNAPIAISLPVREIIWGLDGGTRNPNLPLSDVLIAKDETATIRLVPYGCTELRLTVFPVVPAEKEEDLTDRLLVNPSFEMLDAETYNAGGVERKTQVPYGWQTSGTINGVSYGINNDATTKFGDNICWFRLLPFAKGFELFQTVDESLLEPGIYRVSCWLWNQYNQKGNCRLFAEPSTANGETGHGGVVQYYGSRDEYDRNIVEGEAATFAGYGGGDSNISPKFVMNEMVVFVTVGEGESLRLGIRSDGTKKDGSQASSNDPAGWFKVDNFRIERVDAIPMDNGDEDLTFTAQHLVNPDFELNTSGQPNTSGTTSRGVPYGWQINGPFPGNSYGVNSDGLNKHGQNVCWFNQQGGPMPDDFQLSQTVKGLEGGRYQVRCRLWVQSGQLGRCRLFAATTANPLGSVQYFGRPEDYQLNRTEGEADTFAGYPGGSNSQFIMQEMTVYIDLADSDDLTLGIRSGNMEGNGETTTGFDASGWFKADHFRLKRVSDTTTGIPTPQPHSSLLTPHSSFLYDLQGRRVNTTCCPQQAAIKKGIYIQNGKKYINTNTKL